MISTRKSSVQEIIYTYIYLSTNAQYMFLENRNYFIEREIIFLYLRKSKKHIILNKVNFYLLYIIY